MFAARADEAGFTLIETLVALSILSVAALALMKLNGASAVNAARLEEHAIAQIVARNIAAEALTDPIAPAYGDSQGVIDNALRDWRWARRVARSPEARIQQIDIRVEGSRAAARLTVFRRAGG